MSVSVQAESDGDVTVVDGLDQGNISQEADYLTMSDSTENERQERRDKLLYTINQSPPFYIAVLVGLQHSLSATMSQIAASTLVLYQLCAAGDHVTLGRLVTTMMVVDGICTIIQSTFGIRLPIIQGPSGAFLVPLYTLMSLPQWACQDTNVYSNFTMNQSSLSLHNVSMANLSGVYSADQIITWQTRMHELQGALLGTSVIHIFLGFSGLFGVFLRFISPTVIAVVFVLLGFIIVQIGFSYAGQSWPISSAMIVLAIIFSQYLDWVTVPLPIYSRRRKRCTTSPFPVLQTYTILLTSLVTWLLCYVLTISGALDGPQEWKKNARTDWNPHAVSSAPWFRFPYPFQWGWPTFSVTAVVGMISGVFASTVESIGDYYTCAKLSGAPRPPTHAINRGIGMEGIGNMICAAYGTGLGTTSCSNNIALLVQTRVGSRRVIQFAGLWMLLFSAIGKLGAIFTSFPGPVVGAQLLFISAFVLSAGLSFLQQVSLKLTRNLLVLGMSLVVGLGLPPWLDAHPGTINTGNSNADQLLTVLLKSSMLIGGLTAVILDNTIPGGTKKTGTQDDEEQDNAHQTYDFPFGMKYIVEMKWLSFIPCCPTYSGYYRK